MFRTMLLAAGTILVFCATGSGAVTFNYTGAVQQFTGPAGLYTVIAAGAPGGGTPGLASGGGASTGGAGTLLVVDVPFAAGARLDVIIGGVGEDGMVDPRFPINGAGGGGGGGGTFILGPGRNPIVVAGGGGGGGSGSAVSQRGYSAPVGTAGTDGGTFYGGVGGTAGNGGSGALILGGGGSGGAGLRSDGGMAQGYHHTSDAPGSGNSTSFAGGGPASNVFGALPGGRGGFGGGGAGGGAGFGNVYGGGGGGGGYSGGAGGGLYNRNYETGGGGGGGGSFVTAVGSTLLDDYSPYAQGTGTILLRQVFAKGTVRTDAIDFGTVRAGTSAAVQRTLTVANESSVIIDNGTAYTTRDRIRATLGTLPAAISSSRDYFDLMSVGRSSSNTLSMATDLPGIVSGNIAVNFASTFSIYNPFYAVEGGTVAMTGIVTQVAEFTLGSSGAGQLTSTDASIYSGLYGGTYLLDFGNVVAGRSVVSRLSVLNTLAASGFAENLGGSYAGPFDFDGFSGIGSNFSGIGGGTRGGFNTVDFNAAGQSLGLHSTYFEFYLTSNFRGLDPVFLGLFRIGLQANVIAATVSGVPEPASWSLVIAGFGMVGAAMRRRTARAA